MSPKIRPIIIGISAVFIISIIFYIDSSTERIKYGDYPENQYPCVGNPDSYTCDWNIDHESAVPEDLFANRTYSNELTITRIVEVEREKYFKIMADVKNYPVVLPGNIESIKIIEETDSTIIAEEIIFEQGIRTTLLVKHTFVPYEKHTIEILDGDAKGTKIIAKGILQRVRQNIGY